MIQINGQDSINSGTIPVIDLETIGPNGTEEELQFFSWKLGNMKDEEKIQQKKREKMDMLAVCPFINQIICIGVMFPEHPPVAFCGSDQKELLMAFETYLGEYLAKNQYHSTPFITFNGHAFDIPTLIDKCRRYKMLDLMARIKDSVEFDVMRQIALGAWREYGMMSLKFWLKHYGIPYNTRIHAKDVASCFLIGEYGAIADKCLEDVKATYHLHQLILGEEITWNTQK